MICPMHARAPSVALAVALLLARLDTVYGAAAAVTSSAYSNGSATYSVPPTVTGNVSTLAVTATIKLEDYWNQYIGLVVTGPSNGTTASATPIPASSLVPPPPLYYAPFYSDAAGPPQIAGTAVNESWSLPSDFVWGVSSAAYQVEGAVKEEGRGPSIWDALTHRVVGYTVSNDTADVANDHYYRYKPDIARIAAMGVNAYSFSISWSRVFPYGRGEINEQALAHYDDMIDTCLEYGVEPIVTLYHWDLPLYLQNLYGGWLSEEVVDDFAAYAQVIFERYSSKVSKWITLNEPLSFCLEYPLPEGYFATTDIPKKQQPYYCGQHFILAHAKAYHIGKSVNASNSISFKNNGGYKIPYSNSSLDLDGVQRAWDFQEGWFADPIFLTGDYSAGMKNWTSTFLRDFTSEEVAMIKGSADFFAEDAYAAGYYYGPPGGVAACAADPTSPFYPGCYGASFTASDAEGGWNVGAAADPNSYWLHKSTEWIPALLHYIQDTYKPRAGIVLSEFGFSEPYESVKPLLADIRTDPIRTGYYVDYMKGIMMAISEGVNVTGAIAWTIFDNMEWKYGYNVKFGVQYCNLTTQERYYKASFFEFANIIKTYLKKN